MDSFQVFFESLFFVRKIDMSSESAIICHVVLSSQRVEDFAECAQFAQFIQPFETLYDFRHVR